MEYILSFLEGVITFISPCLLPMLPIYVSYFAGGGERRMATTLKNALGFVAGFTIIFVMMGAFAGLFGSIFKTHRTLVNIITGLIVIFFGLNFLGVFKFNVFRGMKSDVKTDNMGFFSSVLFGVVFSVGWTPCVGAFLGSALTLASQQGSLMTGVLMLLCYSMGLGIPFVVSAVMIDQLKTAFDFIKKHYDVINKICGVLLILVGVMMATGAMGSLLAILS